MDIRGWDERHRQRSREREECNATPTQLVVKTAKRLQPGRALDLACGTGHDALWLASEGWRVTAVDGSVAAIQTLQAEAQRRQVAIETQVVDLEAGYHIAEGRWDLIVIAYYLQRTLLEQAKRGVAPGGVLMVIVHITEHGEEPTASRLSPGELARYFEGWTIEHAYEGKPHDSAHKRQVSEIVARRP